MLVAGHILWVYVLREEENLKLIHCLQLLQIWNQSGPIFQGLEKLNLKLHHFCQVAEQNIQLGEEAI